MSSQLQHQDLSIYSDKSIVSDVLLSDLQYKSLNIITHIQGTSPSWLITGLVENSLTGNSYFNTAGTHHTSRHDVRLNPRSNVILVSFYDTPKFYNRFFKKFLKMDLLNESFKHFKFIDLLSDGITNSVNSKYGVFQKVHEQIAQFNKEDSTKKIQIYVQSPDLLLHMTHMKVDEVLFQIQELNKLADLTLVVPNDKSLIEQQSDNVNDLTNRHAQFLIRLMHRSNAIISLRPLTTGRADDITGQLKISKGLLALDPLSLEVVEKEYLYLANKEGNIKLFFK